MSTFNDFNLDEKILKALDELGYKTPTPIQARAIPMVLSGADLIASAQTGTGKTAAFMLPSLDKLIKASKPKSNTPRILILAPTRELAMQITSVAEKYTRHLPHMKTVCIYGGQPYPIQTKALNRPYSILVATPGRLMDHMEQGRIDLSSVEFLVLDEADRMLDMGFIDAVEAIADATPKNRQTLLFSATLDSKILRLSKKLQNNPEEIHIEVVKETAANIEQRLYFVDGMGHKMRLLDHLLANTKIEQAIIFISTRRGAETLSDELQEKGYVTASLHGNMSQRQRTRTIERFRRGGFNLLVATDVAARGIDILTLSHVINIDLPFQAEDYIHRIGRTGRAGGKGVAITFATYRERQALTQIDKLLASPMTTHTVEGLEPSSSKEVSSQPKQADSRRRGPKRDFGNRGFSKPKFKSDFSNRDLESSNKPKSFDGEKKGRSFQFSGKRKEFDPASRPKRFQSDFPSKPKRFDNDFSSKPKRFDSDSPSKNGRSFQFSGKRKEFKSELEFSSKPKSFDNESSPKQGRTFPFSGKPRGFNADSKRPRGKFGGGSTFEKKKKIHSNPNAFSSNAT